MKINVLIVFLFQVIIAETLEKAMQFPLPQTLKTIYVINLLLK